MVSKPTVLVVGAGASAPFGFPSGRGLVDLVLDDIGQVHTSPKTPVERIRGLRRISPFEEMLRTDEDLFLEADSLGRGLRRSGSYSIDAFVESRRGFVNVCKLAIAARIIPCENESMLFSRESDGPAEVGDWYRYLANCLRDNLERGCKEPLTIVTYNYDRSLEHYLHCALSNSLGLDESRDHEQLANLRVVHLHGSLGRLPWEKSEGKGSVRAYAPSCNDETARNAAKEIKIIHENEDDTFEYGIARECLAKAERVCFLGFGFHRTNVRRLTRGAWIGRLGNDGKKYIRGTAYGLTLSERRGCQDRFREGVQEALGKQHAVIPGGQFELDPNGHACLEFLRNHLELIN